MDLDGLDHIEEQDVTTTYGPKQEAKPTRPLPWFTITLPKIKDEDYNDGYEDGYEEGYDQGNIEGHADGYEEGFDEGREEGHDAGHDEGYDMGHKEGVADTEILCAEKIEEAFEEGYEAAIQEIQNQDK